MRVLISVQLLVPLLLVLGVYLATTRDQVAMVRLANRDDWRGLRDRAAAVVERDSRFVPGAVRAHAAQLLGVAHLVLGELPAARDALHRVLAGDPPAPVRAAAERQLASVERSLGEVAAARVRLEQQSARSGRDDAEVATQLAMVLLDGGDPAAAERSALEAVEDIERQLESAHTKLMRSAMLADLAQARSILVRARLEQGDAAGATAAWAALRPPDARPYVRGQLAETEARVAWAGGDRVTAQRAADEAWARYEEVGARVDLARTDVLRARIAVDARALDAAEADLRRLGAFGHLWEVDQARREIGGLG